MKPNIEISDKNLKFVAALLNNLVADEFVLYTKTRNAHWNIVGPGFMELHKFFQSQYEQLDEIIDGVAERVRSLGHFALGSLKDFTALTRLNEKKYDISNQNEMIKDLLADHETIIRILRKDIVACAENKDLGTSDFVCGLMEQHEKMAWMLRSYLS